jgi:hypothetical protein
MTEKQKILVWATDNALTEGIYPVVGEISGESGNVVYTNRLGYSHLLFRYQWFLTREEAEKKAEEMRREKIKSLLEQINKLESLDFGTDGCPQ